MRILLSLILLTASFISTASVSIEQTANIDCKLTSKETLVIGCTNYCGRFNKWALKWYARKLNYNIKVVNLRSKYQSIDHTQVDGILIPGGSDIDPKWYISKVDGKIKDYLESVKHLAIKSEIGTKRDEFEFSLLDDYFSNEAQRYQPVLGICRGMQVLTVSQGIPLYVDIKTELGIKNRRYTLDQVNVLNPESLIKELIPRDQFRAVELHHQGLRLDYYLQHKEEWPQLEVTAVSNQNKIAEVLEFYNRPILGVQFHPEYTFGKVRRGVFKWLLKRACFNKIMGKKLTTKEIK